MQSEDFIADIPFSIPQVHRLRMTEDVLGKDVSVLLTLLEPSGTTPPRVQIWIDSHLADADPKVLEKLNAIFSTHSDRFQIAGPIQKIVGGEACKNDPALVDRLLNQFYEYDLDRRSYVIAVGGGAVLDVVGYAASIAHRGLRLVRIPTTTLAQADSGVGVKTAVNWFGKKNWKGTFSVPWGVINDRTLLTHLPDKEFRCGFSEAVKVSLLKDPHAFNWLCERASQIASRDLVVSHEAIVASVKMHLDHITNNGDPFELLEARPLDFGHWSAHRLEALSQFHLRHGEAVSIGVAIDTLYSSMVHGFPEQDAHRVLKCLTTLGLPIFDDLLNDTDTLREGLEEFRQHLGGRLTITMLQDVGDPIDVHQITWHQMQRAIAHVRDFSTS